MIRDVSFFFDFGEFFRSFHCQFHLCSNSCGIPSISSLFVFFFLYVKCKLISHFTRHHTHIPYNFQANKRTNLSVRGYTAKQSDSFERHSQHFEFNVLHYIILWFSCFVHFYFPYADVNFVTSKVKSVYFVYFKNQK